MSIARREAVGLLMASVLPPWELAFASPQSPSGPGEPSDPEDQGAVPHNPPQPLLPKQVIYTGTEATAPRQIPLRAGPMTLLFEPELAQIRTIRLGPVEVWRAVYAAVRDHNWDTILPVVRDLRITTTDDGFSVRFTAECRRDEIHLVWQGELDGEASGRIRFQFSGKALSAFRRNRIGFCVLHDGEKLPGQPVQVETVNGQQIDGHFPLHIAPHQPFMNIRAITHSVSDGLRAEVRMEGDTFEMEDQRNWTDASFKTYCTPLALPFPVEIAQGTEIEQTVTLQLLGNQPPRLPTYEAAEVLLGVHADSSNLLPAIGAMQATESTPITAAQVARLRAAGIAHVRADLKLFEPSWQATFTRALGESQLLDVPLELAIHLSDDAAAELASLAETCRSRKPALARVLVFHRDEKSTTRRWMQVAREVLRPVLSGVPIGSGSDAYFTEVNRGRPPLDVSDFVAWSTNPQVHAFDNLSLAETLTMHRTTLESARGFCGNLPLVVSPVSLKPRFNPNATGEASIASDALPDSVDPRQRSLFGAGWTLGCLKYLARGGASAVTMYETTGWRGWMEMDAGPLLPERFREQAGWVFPLYHVLADWAEFAGGDVVWCTSSQPLDVEAVALRKGNRVRVMLANLSGRTRAVRLPTAQLGDRFLVKRLDEHSALRAMQQPEAWRREPGALLGPADGHCQLSLLPYAVLRMDRSEG